MPIWLLHLTCRTIAEDNNNIENDNDDDDNDDDNTVSGHIILSLVKLAKTITSMTLISHFI